MFGNIRKPLKGFLLFGMGCAAALIFERFILEDGTRVIKLFFILGIMFIVYISLYWPEFKNCLWQYNQSDHQSFPLKIEAILGLHLYLAKHQNAPGRFELQCDPNDRNRPDINVGDNVIVNGKFGNLPLGGHITLVNCKVRLQR